MYAIRSYYDQFRERVEKELKDGILGFWLSHSQDDKWGGFHGLIYNDNSKVLDADKGLIQNARNLWSFARAYNYFKDEIYLDIAYRAKDYLLEKFWDNEFGGFIWLVNPDGTPKNSRKQIYGQAFAIYALSEFYISTGDSSLLEYAAKTFSLIEKYSLDRVNNGYIEALSKEWKPVEDIRLSEIDLNEPKSNNTHLHIMEAYTSYSKVTNDVEVIKRLKNVVDVMLYKVMDKRTRNNFV